MSTVEERVQTLLTVNSGVTDLVPADRISVPGDIQGRVAPYIVHFPAAPGDPTQTHEGRKDLTFWHEYQVSVFAETYGQAKQIAVAVVAALDGHRDEGTDRIALVRAPFPLADYDGDRRLEHIACAFMIAGALD